MIRALKATTLLFLGAVTLTSLSTPCSADYLVTWTGLRLHPYKNKPGIPGVTRAKGVFRIADLPPMGKCRNFTPRLISYTDGVDTGGTLAAAGYTLLPGEPALQLCLDKNNNINDGEIEVAFAKLDQNGNRTTDYFWKGNLIFPQSDRVFFDDYVNHTSLNDHHAPIGATVTVKEVGN